MLSWGVRTSTPVISWDARRQKCDYNSPYASEQYYGDKEHLFGNGSHTHFFSLAVLLYYRKEAMWGSPSILLILLLLITPASSQPSDIFRVKLHVSADTQIQAQVESYLARDLLRLGDVEIAQSAHHWFLHILVTDLKPDKGYVLSIVILENTTIEFNNQAAYIPDLHAIYVNTDLPTLCARAVEAFDNTSLTPARVARRARHRQDGR
jgi:hypothetical protein